MSHEEDLENMEPQDAKLEEPQQSNKQQQQQDKEQKYQLKDIDLCSIFVRNLEENTTEEDVKDYFKDCGTIIKVTLRGDKHLGTQYAYVQFQEAQAVDDALMLSEGIIRGRKILVFPKRTNLRGRGKGVKGPRGKFIGKGRYVYVDQVKGRGAYRGVGK